MRRISHTKSIFVLLGVGALMGCDTSSRIPDYVRQQALELSKNPQRNPLRDNYVNLEPAPDPRLTIPPREEWTMQHTAADALSRIGAAAVPQLVTSLESRDSQTRMQAAEVLARMGPDAKEAVPSLVRALHDEDPLIRKAAARALGQIGPAAADAVPDLMRMLKEKDE